MFDPRVKSLCSFWMATHRTTFLRENNSSTRMSSGAVPLIGVGKHLHDKFILIDVSLIMFRNTKFEEN